MIGHLDKSSTSCRYKFTPRPTLVTIAAQLQLQLQTRGLGGRRAKMAP
eukprot:SAG11_NODE_36048_length_263_cov_1.384146_1_plen_47_part_01